MEKKRVTESELEHVLDYLNSSAAPKRLLKMSVVDAKRLAAAWSKSNQKKGKGFKDTDTDIEVVHDFNNGTRIVRLKSKAALQREGRLMAHCVGGYDVTNTECLIYSYRDEKNMPHATFEVRKAGREIVQIKGKGNGPIHPKYIHVILSFLSTIGMTIRPNDMKNLGYYVVADEHLVFIKSLLGSEKQVTVIHGINYAHD